MRKLYQENLRRLAPAGLLLTLFFGALSLLLGLSHSKNTLIHIEELNFLLYIFPYGAGAGLTIAGFSFLNKRSSSDLYLGLPYKRATLYWGVMLSILTWGAISLGVSLLLTGLGFGMRNCLFLWSHIGILFVYWFIAFALVAGALALGQCFSGQWFFGLSWGLVLLFMGRYILFIHVMFMDDILPGMIVWGYGGILNPGIQFATGLLANVLNMFTGVGIENSFFSPGGYIYSFLLSLVYMALGTLAFCKRKGELSGSAASGLKMQHLLSILTGFVPTLPGLWLAMNLNRVSTVETSICLLGFLTFLAYELIASRSVKKTLKAVGWYAVSLAAAAACIGCMYLGAKLYEKAIPTKGEEIASVAFMEVPGLAEDGVTASREARISEIQLTNSRLLNLTAEGIQACSEDSFYRNYSYTVRTRVRLKNGMTMYLRCLVSEELNALLKEQEAYREVISSRGQEVLGVRLWNDGLDPAMQEKYIALYEKIVEEEALYPFDNQDVPMIPLWVYVKEGLQIYEDRVYLRRTRSPEAAKMLVDICHTEEALAYWQREDVCFDSLLVQDQSPNNGLTVDVSPAYYEDSVKTETLLNLLRRMPLAEGTEERILRVKAQGHAVEGNGGYNVSGMSFSLFLAPTEEQYEEYVEFLRKAGYYEESYYDAAEYDSDTTYG